MVLLQKSIWESWTTAMGPVLGFPVCFTVSFEPKTNTNVSTHHDGSTLLKLALAARPLICSRNCVGTGADPRAAVKLILAAGSLGASAASFYALSRSAEPKA